MADAEDWSRVKWTEARQVTRLVKSFAIEGLDLGMAPKPFFEMLREAGRLTDAVRFLGTALPRWETVAWAGRVLRDEERERTPAEAAAVRSILLWVQDPSEARRRAAQEAGAAVDPISPECLGVMAVFYSGGSIGPANSKPVPAPREAAGRFAYCAVLTSTGRAADRKAALNRALDLGVSLAAEPAREKSV